MVEFSYEEKLEAQNREEKKRRQQFLSDLRSVSDRESGLRILDYIIEMTGIYQDAFTGRSDTFYNCGKQVIGKQLLADLDEADPRIYLKILESRIGENDA